MANIVSDHHSKNSKECKAIEKQKISPFSLSRGQATEASKGFVMILHQIYEEAKRKIIIKFMRRRKEKLSLSFKQNKEQLWSSFLVNGSMLLEEYMRSCNGRYNIPIRNFSAKEILRATNYFEQPRLIGKDTDFKLYKGCLEERLILVKKFNGESCRPFAIQDIVITSQMRRHKNVASLFGCCLEFEGPALLYEYSGGVLLSDLLSNRDGAYIHEHEDGSIGWKSRVRIAKEIANAVTYLHTALSRPVVNRDLKPKNILVDQHGVAKLFDFSVSISISPNKEEPVRNDYVAGTLAYIDPESFHLLFETEKSDVYAFGILLLELLTGRTAIFKHPKEDMIQLTDYAKKYVGNGQFNKILDPRILGGSSETGQEQQAFLKLALRCVQLKRQDRPEMMEVAKELRRIERSGTC